MNIKSNKHLIIHTTISFDINHNTALIPADTQEKAYFSHAPKPCGKTERGCGKCICCSYQLFDSDIIPYDHYRSEKHFDKFCNDNPNATKDDLSKRGGYSTFESFESNSKALGGDSVVQKLACDINHSVLNQVKYLDRSVKADYVWVCDFFFRIKIIF